MSSRKEEMKTSINYHGFEISDDDSSYDNIIISQKPSDIKVNDNNIYETDSDDSGYNENNIIATSRRRPSFVRDSINSFSKRITNSNHGTTKNTLGIVTVKQSSSCCCSLM